jgi:hypothetical protein
VLIDCVTLLVITLLGIAPCVGGFGLVVTTEGAYLSALEIFQSSSTLYQWY